MPSLISVDETPTSALAGTELATSASEVAATAARIVFLRRKLIISFLPSRVCLSALLNASHAAPDASSSPRPDR